MFYFFNILEVLNLIYIMYMYSNELNDLCSTQFYYMEY